MKTNIRNPSQIKLNLVPGCNNINQLWNLEKGGKLTISRSVVPLVDALEDKYGSILRVPETNKTLQNIRKHLNKTIIKKPEVFLEVKVGSSAKPCVLINKKTGEKFKFKALKHVGPAMGHSRSWGDAIRKKESRTYRIEFLPQEQMASKAKQCLKQE